MELTKQQSPTLETREEDETASLLASVLDATADGVLVVDLCGRMLTWNRRFAELWRIPADILASREDEIALRFVINQLEEPEVVLAKVHALYEDAEAESFDTIPLRDGRVFERFSVPQRMNGKAVGRVWSFRDVTSRTRVEQSLRRSEERYRTLIERNLAGVFRSTFDGRLIECNDALVRLLGYSSRDELLSIPAADLYVDRSDRDDLTGELWRVGFVTNREIRFRRRDGAIIWALANVSLAIEESAGAACLEGTVVDISDKRRAVDQLRRSEAYFRALIENASEGILVIDRSGVIRYASPSMLQITGHSPSELTGTQSRNFLHPNDLERASIALTQGISLPGSTTSLVFRLRHRDGGWRSVDAVASNLSEVVGISGVVVNLHDITERLALEKQLEAANHLSSLGRLAATIAHEVNNVLMGIQPFAEVIERTRDRSKIENAASRILDSVQRGRRIAQQILRYTRPAEPTPVPIDLHAWMAGLGEELPALVGPPIEVDVRTPHEPLFVLADPVQISQALTNLALNARDAMPDGGRLSISVDDVANGSTFSFGVVPTPDRFVHFTIRDHGRGMEPKVLDRIFEPLFSTKRNGGTGLGLTVVRQIVAAHEGEIFVESTPGIGTTFHLFLPKTRPKASEQDEEDPVKSGGNVRKGRRILIVEDDEAVAAGLQGLLECEGHLTDIIREGGRAEERVERFRPDAVILDVYLPDMDGAELFHLLSRRWPDLPVIFSTGHGDERQMSDYLARPNVRFLRKPYGARELFDQLEELLPAH